MWGTGLENALIMEFPLFDILTDRPWREGSEIIQVGAVDEAWRTGADFTLQCEARWIRDGGDTFSPVSGALGWQAFLDWARDANAFRFVPDETVPDFYIDNCYLVEPRKGHGSLTTDIKRKTAFTIRNATMDFHQALRGIMFEYAPGASLTDPVAATFSRATAGTYRGIPGNLAAAIGANAASGVLRDRHYEGTLRTTLLEAARTQLVTDPENFGAWTVGGTPVLTSGQADPFGGTAAYLIEDNDAAAVEWIERTVVYTGNATKAQLGFVKASTAGITDFELIGAALRVRVRVTWTGGVASAAVNAGSGTARAVAWGGGWYLIEWTADGVVALDTNRYLLIPAGNVAANTGSVYFFGANAWNAPFPPSYQGPALGSRSGDAFSWPFTYKPQAMFVLVDFIEREPGIEAGGIIGLPLNNADPRFLLDKVTSGSGYRLLHDTGATLVTSVVAPSTAYGDRMQLLALLYSDGHVRLSYAKNLGAEVLGGVSGALALPAAWSTTVLGLMGWSGGRIDTNHAWIRAKIGPLIYGGVTRDSIAKAQAA